MKRYEDSLLTVRFVGKGLGERGVGIYDLGLTLIAFQRVVHKAYLIEKERFKRGAFPVTKEREWLSFQIGERKRQSDAYALIPIVTDPAFVSSVSYIADSVFNALLGYYTGKILDGDKFNESERQVIINGAIYAEVVNIVGRIEASGGVEKIEIGAPGLDRREVVSFDASHKEFISSLKNKYSLGKVQTIVGRVFKLYPDSKIVQIRRPGHGKCTIFLDGSNFDKIRYSQSADLTVTFSGRPRYPFGVDSQSIAEFEAYSLQFGEIR
ncbi:MAG: hypothetical protein RL042_1462 [Nitrospirota bacterium]